MFYTVEEADRALFTSCRRAWDFGARTRRNYEPRVRAGFDLERVIRDTLAVYYFPGMWDWQPPVVLPVVRAEFQRAVGRQRAGLPGRDADWTAEVAFGERLLEAYFGWAPEFDVFCPVRVETDVEVQVPEPTDPDRGVVTPAGEAVRYRTRLDLLVVDELNCYWVVEHRLVHGAWPDPEELAVAGQSVAWCWAWQEGYPGMRIVGTIHNLLRVDADHAPGPPPVHARGRVAQNRGAYVPPIGVEHDEPSGPRLVVEGNGAFRRVRIRRSPAEITEAGARIAAQVREMADPSLALYPDPTPHNCARCGFRRPCITMSEGGDVGALLAQDYRHRRPAEEVEEGRLGGGLGTGRGGIALPEFLRPG